MCGCFVENLGCVYVNDRRNTNHELVILKYGRANSSNSNRDFQ